MHPAGDFTPAMLRCLSRGGTKGSCKMNSTKPGYRTSEFWLSLLAMLLGALMASGAVCTAHDTPLAQILCRGAGVVLSLLSTLGYTASRSAVKLGTALSAPYDPTKSAGT